jgi:hypothetical protein
MSTWAIENTDDAGEGLFVCEAESPEAAIALFRKHERGVGISEVTRIEWISLATVQGKLGETSYYEKARKETLSDATCKPAPYQKHAGHPKCSTEGCDHPAAFIEYNQLRCFKHSLRSPR